MTARTRVTFALSVLSTLALASGCALSGGDGTELDDAGLGSDAAPGDARTDLTTGQGDVKSTDTSRDAPRTETAAPPGDARDAFTEPRGVDASIDARQC